MPRKCLFDVFSSGKIRETIDMELKAREHWYKHNKEVIWRNNIGPIQGRIMDICADKKKLSQMLMDSQDEYFKFCGAKETPPKETPKELIIQVGPDPCDECTQNLLLTMRTVPEVQMALLQEGLSSEGRGVYGYLKDRYNCGLPETKFCRPPTSNSEYAWKLMENVRNNTTSMHPRKNAIGTFYRSQGALCHNDFAPYHFP